MSEQSSYFFYCEQAGHSVSAVKMVGSGKPVIVVRQIVDDRACEFCAQQILTSGEPCAFIQSESGVLICEACVDLCCELVSKARAARS